MRKSKSSKSTPSQSTPASVTPSIRARDTAATAREHYHREKARRARLEHPDRELIAAARREYLALLEADAIKGKGGRPKKRTAQPAVPTDDTDTDEHDEGDEPEE